jgi:hypothetical protein
MRAGKNKTIKNNEGTLPSIILLAYGICKMDNKHRMA